MSDRSNSFTNRQISARYVDSVYFHQSMTVVWYRSNALEISISISRWPFRHFHFHYQGSEMEMETEMEMIGLAKYFHFLPFPSISWLFQNFRVFRKNLSDDPGVPRGRLYQDFGLPNHVPHSPKWSQNAQILLFCTTTVICHHFQAFHDFSKTSEIFDFFSV